MQFNLETPRQQSPAPSQSASLEVIAKAASLATLPRNENTVEHAVMQTVNECEPLYRRIQKLAGQHPKTFLGDAHEIPAPHKLKNASRRLLRATLDFTVQTFWTRSSSADGLHEPALQRWRRVLGTVGPDQPTSNPLAAKYLLTPPTGSDCHISNDAYRWAM